jgi:hypothetical protein
MENNSMNVNRSKTKEMVCGTNVTEIPKMRLRNHELQEVDIICYLGSKITKDGPSTNEANSRLAQAERTLYQKKNYSLPINELKTKKFLKADVWSMALYGCETWIIGSTDTKRFEAL